MTLQHFWADQGCLIWQPYYTQVGAGTMNPATFLRVLGPEPWKVAYVEPSIRPDDARYGENPNRMQMHYQFQVILKPDPGNPQELYLKSLKALGVDPRQHDIRFVEDNWNQPALGAWGLGWEVWLDGQEITQFTYLQQAGGQMLDPVSVEMTYGLDRIAIAIQRVNGFTEIHWNDGLTSGDINLQAEQEHSKYYFEIADVDRLRQMYDLYDAEARACLTKGLVLPAHDYILKCSHAFNVLDAHGAIGVTERQAYFGRMRDLARQVSEAYLEQRQRLEYPWLKDSDSRVESRRLSNQSHLSPMQFTTLESQVSHPLLFEIGTEELPVGDLEAALEQLRTHVPATLAELHLQHGDINVIGTPRRLVVFVEELASRQPDVEQVVKGPPAERAFDLLGQPTKAGEGFARSKGLAVRDLQEREMDGGRYVVAVLRQAGRPAAVVLAEALPGLVASLSFDKSMRWNSSNVYFSRPIRWLLALYGDQVIPFEYAGLQSNNKTHGLRFTQPEEIVVQKPADYFPALAGQGILLDPSERQKRIQSQIDLLASQVQGNIAVDPALLAEVANLVEAPTALRGSFDPAHLHLPREVLISVMKKHQRYFPVQHLPSRSRSEKGNSLLPYFITVANKPIDDTSPDTSSPGKFDLIVEGNELVIRARFTDADFFVKDDMKHPLTNFLPRLGTLTFQAKLGSMLEKTHRITDLVGMLASGIGLNPDDTSAAQRAAELCKADLATKMVVDMTSLQGIIGRYYALHSGESEAVATAIFEHYLPRFAGDDLPQTLPGLAVSLCDRLDTLVGLFAAGLAPTGAKDPFAQRRTALGLVQCLISHDLDFDLRSALQATASCLPIPASDDILAACLAFIIERLRNLLLEQGSRYDVVDAVLEAQGYNPARAARAITELSAWVRRPDWHTFLPAYARCVRITRDQQERYPVNTEAFREPDESQLDAALQTAEAVSRAPGSVNNFLNAFLPMIPTIDRFFDTVLVMDENPGLRQNRLGLLQRIAVLAEDVADMSRLEGF